ncbi:MAG: M20 family metallopeptidase [Chloroflexi bacterium]|nr:M20 family metallopeptidase [Chloroflexota bacterium]MCL5075260.1 M20 family metallopeptidase [Chloroflexota bacterium]
MESVVALKKQLLAEVDRLAPRLIALSHEIHAHPELKFEEVRAANLLSTELETAGFIVRRGVAGLATAFIGTAQGSAPGPNVALLGEYDALPEIGHGCGHNLIGVISLGAALALKKVLPSLAGRVTYLGTPAEEGGAGKALMVKADLFADVAAAMLVHPAGITAVESSSLASIRVEFTFKGKPAHAAASPEEGISALDALLQTFNNINALRQFLRDDVRIHGIITKGGVAPHIVPDHTEAEFRVRAADTNYMLETLEKVKRCAEAGALATGATVSIRTSEHPIMEMRSNRALAKAFTASYAALGIATDESGRKKMGSTDMGNVSHVVPAIHPRVAIGSPGLVSHTPEFAAAADSETGHQAMLLAAKAMALTTLDLLTKPGLLAEIREEFEKH